MDTTAKTRNFLKIHPSDNVLVALGNLTAGAIIEEHENGITLKENIPAKHKFFISDM